MSDVDDQTNDEDLVPRSQIRDLEAKASRVPDLERRLAFAEALGPRNPEDKQRHYFEKGYEGELTAQAIRDEATKAGFLRESSGEQAAPQASPDLDAHARVAAASTGAGQGNTIPLEEAIAAAQSAEEVMTAVEAAGFPTVRNRV